MTTIDATTSAPAAYAARLASAPNAATSVDRDGDHDGSRGGTRVGATQAAALIQSLIQALGQAAGVGVNPTASTTTAPAGASGPAAQDDTLRPDLQAFLHSLFGSLHNASSVSSQANGAGRYQHAGIIDRLQSLIGSLSHSDPNAAQGTAPGDVTSLNDAFQRLMKDLGAADNSVATASGATADTTALQNFLNHLLQDLQSGTAGTEGVAGGVINATA